MYYGLRVKMFDAKDHKKECGWLDCLFLLVVLSFGN